jgi:hypothetical protein
MATIILSLIALFLIGALLYTIAAPDRHSRMTEREFTEEAKRSSMVGQAMIGLDKALRPNRVEHVLVEKQRAQRRSAIPGEPPREEQEAAETERQPD